MSSKDRRVSSSDLASKAPSPSPRLPLLRPQCELARFGVKVRFTDAPDLAADDPQVVLLTQVQGCDRRVRESQDRRTLPARQAVPRPRGRDHHLKGLLRLPAHRAQRRRRSRRRGDLRAGSSPWCGGSPPSGPPAPRSGRSAGSSTPTASPHRPASPPGGTPPSAGYCATRPTSGASTSTAPS